MAKPSWRLSTCSLSGRSCKGTCITGGSWGRGFLPGSAPGYGREEGAQYRGYNERMNIRNSSFQTCGEMKVGPRLGISGGPAICFSPARPQF